MFRDRWKMWVAIESRFFQSCIILKSQVVKLLVNSVHITVVRCGNLSSEATIIAAQLVIAKVPGSQIVVGDSIGVEGALDFGWQVAIDFASLRHSIRPRCHRTASRIEQDTNTETKDVGYGSCKRKSIVVCLGCRASMITSSLGCWSWR